MAYQANEATIASQPLKLKEYMATGRAVVARSIPATLDWADAIDLYTSSSEFSSSVRNRIATGVEPSQVAARRRLDVESWETKARSFGSTVTGQEIDQALQIRLDAP
jgi:hypothetical protein